MNEIIVIRDTREKRGWDFSNSSACSEVIDKKLETGDYSVKGLEHILVLERKASTAELATSISKAAFKNELVRMEKIPHRFLILEFSLQDVLDFPRHSTVPESKWNKLRVSNRFIMKRLTEIQVNQNIHVIFADNKEAAKYIAINIMKEIYGRYSK